MSLQPNYFQKTELVQDKVAVVQKKYMKYFHCIRQLCGHC